MSKKVLACLVCGYERGGTTLLSELIRQHPHIDGRFEIGFLLAESLAEFPNMHPFARNVKIAWGLDDETLTAVCQAESFQEAYARLLVHSNLPDKNVQIYDKTPRYMKFLPQVMEKVAVPVVCVVRDPRGVYWSAQKHWDPENLELGKRKKLYEWLIADNKPTWLSNASQNYFEHRRDRIKIDAFCQYYINYGQAYQEAKARFSDQILLVQYDALCTDPVTETRRVYDFLGLQFDDAYLSFPKQPDQYVDRGGIRPELIYEYRHRMRKRDQRRILKLTSAFSEWHWLE